MLWASQLSFICDLSEVIWRSDTKVTPVLRIVLAWSQGFCQLLLAHTSRRQTYEQISTSNIFLFNCILSGGMIISRTSHPPAPGSSSAPLENILHPPSSSKDLLLIGMSDLKNSNGYLYKNVEVGDESRITDPGTLLLLQDRPQLLWRRSSILLRGSSAIFPMQCLILIIPTAICIRTVRLMMNLEPPDPGIIMNSSGECPSSFILFLLNN